MSHHETDEMEAARKRAKSSRKQIETGGRFKPAEGSHTVRILETPPDKERDSPALYLEYQTHNNVGPNNRFCRCGNEPGESGKCWLCKKRDQLEKKGKTKSAAKLAPQLKLVVQVAVLDQDLDQMVGPLLWEMSSGKSADAIGYKIRGVISSDRRNYTDHKRGYNLHFTRTGQMLKTKWSDLDHDDEPSKVSSGILKQLKPFVDTGMPTYDEQWQKDCYYGNDKTKGEDEMPAKKKSKKVDESDASSDASQVDESSDASSNASDVDESSDTTTKKKKKKKDESDESSDASSNESDTDESSDSSDTDDSDDGSDKDESSDASSDTSSDSSDDDSDADTKKKKKKKDESDEDESDASSASSSNASDVDESDEEEKPKKRKTRADKGKPRGAKAKTKKTKKAKK